MEFVRTSHWPKGELVDAVVGRLWPILAAYLEKPCYGRAKVGAVGSSIRRRLTLCNNVKAD